MKLIAAHVFEARGIGRAAEESREVLDPLHVVMLGLRRELADRHVFDHALPQRAYGLIGHEGCSCLDEGCEPLISRQDAPSCYRVGCVVRRGALPRERFSPLALFRHGAMSDLSPWWPPKRTSADHAKFVASRATASDARAIRAARRRTSACRS